MTNMAEVENATKQFPEEIGVKRWNKETQEFEHCTMQKFDHLTEWIGEDYQVIMDLINEEKIHKVFFSKAPLGSTKPDSYLHDTKQPYLSRYFIRNSDGKVVGFFNIKPTKVSDEVSIGYMASEHFRGVMTNTVSEVIETCRKLGFKKIVADCLESNKESVGVLERAGLTPPRGNEKTTRDERVFLNFEILL